MEIFMFSVRNINPKKKKKIENQKIVNDVISQFKIQKKYNLKRLELIEGFTKENLNKNLKLYFSNRKRSFLIKFESIKHRNFFLFKLSLTFKDHFLILPKIRNLDEVELFYDDQVEDEMIDNSITRKEITEMIGEEEEKLLKEILDHYQMKITNGKSVCKVLEIKLEDSNEAFIKNVISIEKQWRGLLKNLTNTKSDLLEIKNDLDKYCDELSSISEDSLTVIEQENNLMSSQSKNLANLEKELTKLIEKLKYNEKGKKILNDYDFANDSQLKKILNEVDILQQLLNYKFKEKMEEMNAVQERKLYFKQLLVGVKTRFVDFLTKKFSDLGMEFNSKKIQSDILKQNKKVHSLKKYQNLMNIVKLHDKENFSSLQISYCNAVSPLYKSELGIIFFRTKQIISLNKESQKKNMFLLGNENFIAIVEDVENGKFLEKKKKKKKLSILDDFIANTDLRVDKAIDLNIKGLCKLILNEHTFCLKFFILDDSNIDDLKFLTDIMDRLFYSSLIEYFDDLVIWISKKCDLFYSIAILHLLQEKHNQYQKNALLSKILGYVFGNVKIKLYEKFLKYQEESILKYKKSIKKTTVAPFVAKLSSFQKKIRLISRLYEKFDNKYSDELVISLIKIILEKIEILKDSSEKHSSVFCMKNYCYLYRIGENKTENEVIKKYITVAKERFIKNREEYILKLLSYQKKFQIFFEFFKEIKKSLTEMDLEDISLQTKFSKQKFLKILSIFQENKKIKRKKILEECLFRMGKHVGKFNVERSSFKFVIKEFNMFSETWKYFCDFLVEKLKEFEKIIKTCYVDYKFKKMSKFVKIELLEITKEKKDQLQF